MRQVTHTHTHTLAHACAQNEQAVGDEWCSREAMARVRLGDTLPNKAANLGDAVSVCRTPQQASMGLAWVGREFRPPLCPRFK